MALLTLAVLVLGMLTACGSNKTPTAKDAEGEWGNGFSWTYTSASKTLSISGNGDMTVPDTDEETTALKYPWASIRASVEKVTFGENISGISDYAFYGMSNLTSVSFSSTLTKLGKGAFAFCYKLESAELPEGVISVGESAFEGCSALTSVKLPATLTDLGARAFAFCDALKLVSIKGAPESIGKWTFKGCISLEKLEVPNGYDSARISSEAFDGAKIDYATYVDVERPCAITIKYVNESGEAIRTESHASSYIGQNYTATALTVDGYTLKDTASATQERKLALEAEEFTFVYVKKVQEPTETEPVETETPEEESNPVKTAIILVVFAVLIIAIGVGAFLFARSSKNQPKNTTTVRKNGTNSKSKRR